MDNVQDFQPAKKEKEPDDNLGDFRRLPSISPETRLQNELKQVIELQNKDFGAPMTVLDWHQQPVTDKVAHSLGKLHDLEILNLAGTQITDKAAPDIAKHSKLSLLDLSNTSISDKGLDQLRYLADITRLYLSNTQITDKGLESLKGMSSLDILDLSYNQITDKGIISAAGNLGNLSYLNLNGTSISDIGLKAVADNCKKLGSINLEGTKVSRAGIDYLHRALPECNVLSVPLHLLPAQVARPGVFHPVPPPPGAEHPFVAKQDDHQLPFIDFDRQLPPPDWKGPEKQGTSSDQLQVESKISTDSHKLADTVLSTTANAMAHGFRWITADINSRGNFIVSNFLLREQLNNELPRAAEALHTVASGNGLLQGPPSRWLNGANANYLRPGERETVQTWQNIVSARDHLDVESTWGAPIGRELETAAWIRNHNWEPQHSAIIGPRIESAVPGALRDYEQSRAAFLEEQATVNGIHASRALVSLVGAQLSNDLIDRHLFKDTPTSIRTVVMDIAAPLAMVGGGYRLPVQFAGIVGAHLLARTLDTRYEDLSFNSAGEFINSLVDPKLRGQNKGMNTSLNLDASNSLKNLGRNN